jgi:DNA-binding transcriptional LysR family regulator
VADGLVDFGFLPYPPQEPRAGLAREVVLTDELMAVVPEGHALAAKESVTLAELAAEPFILLERGNDNEVSPLFEHAGLEPRSRLSTWDDYAIMSMVENGLGLSILPGLILTRCPYRVEARPLDPPVTRQIAAVFRPGLLSSAARAFLDCMVGERRE